MAKRQPKKLLQTTNVWLLDLADHFQIQKALYGSRRKQAKTMVGQAIWMEREIIADKILQYVKKCGNIK